MAANPDIAFEELREIPGADRRHGEAVPALEVFSTFLKLGATSFGGPGTHLELQRQELVERRGWSTPQAFGELVGMCHFLPGVSSSQIGVAMGALVGGFPGAVAAWLGFLLPSSLAMALLGTLASRAALRPSPAWVHGLEVFACAMIANAAWSLGKSLHGDRNRVATMLAAAAVSFLAPPSFGPLAGLVFGALAGLFFLKPDEPGQAKACRFSGAKSAGGCVGKAFPATPIPLGTALLSAGAFAVIFFILTLWSLQANSPIARISLAFFETGGSVFGSGQMILPLVQSHMVAQGLVATETFLVGYGLAQVLPGSTFSLAAFLGGVTAGWTGALCATLAIFLPGFLLVVAFLPLWTRFRERAWIRRTLVGVNAAVVGLLLCALYHIAWGGGIGAPVDIILVAAALAIFSLWRLPTWTTAVALSLAGILFLGPSSWISRLPLDGYPKVQLFLGLPVRKSVVRLSCPKGRVGMGNGCSKNRGTAIPGDDE